MEIQQAYENGKQGEEITSVFQKQETDDAPKRALLLRIQVMTAGKDD